MGDFSSRVVERTVHRLGALYFNPTFAENDKEGGLSITMGEKEIRSYIIISKDIDTLVVAEMTKILNSIETKLQKGFLHFGEKTDSASIQLVPSKTDRNAKSTESPGESICSISWEHLEQGEETQIPREVTLHLKVNIGMHPETDTIDLYEINAEFDYYVEGEPKNAGYSNVLRGFGFQKNVMKTIIGTLDNENMSNINGMQISCIINQYTWYQLPKYQTEFPKYKWMISDPRLCPLDRLPVQSFDFLTVGDKEDENYLKKIFIHYWNKNTVKESDENTANDSNENTAKESIEVKSLLEELKWDEKIADICFQKECIFFLHVPHYQSLIKSFDSHLKSFSDMSSEYPLLNANQSNEFRRAYRDKIIKSFTEFEMYYIDRDDSSKPKAELKALFSYSATNAGDDKTAAFLLSLFFDCFDMRISTLRDLKYNAWCQVLDRCNIYAFKRDPINEIYH